ncbi:AMP-binding protein [Streptomyces sp. NPDC085614]|uniref:AMP-binding protein n=1 Tax=Streptomyces sp. NPDC085614 TaxID=3365733 RepID=UPI0037CD67B4
MSSNPQSITLTRYPFSVRQEGEIRGFRADATVHDLVERWAERTPDAVAVTDGVETLTYAGLSERANRLAHFLVEAGARPGSRVGVCLPRGIDAVVAFLAALKSGCAYVPMDANYPAERLAFMAEDAGLALTVTADLLREKSQEISSLPCESPGTASGGDDIADVIYTSGSTGRPKGVEVRHNSVVALVRCADFMGVDGTSRFLHASSISFDAAVLEIWSALLCGGRLVVAPDGPLSSAELSSELLAGVTHAMIPTALFHRQAADAPESFAGLRVLAVGGEALGSEHARAVCRANPNLRLVNLYGPTEVTVYCTYHVMEGVEEVADPAPIGRPAANVRLRVLDAGLRPVPVGEVGELFVGGGGGRGWRGGICIGRS